MSVNGKNIRGAGGFALPEILVASLIGLIVAAGAMTFLTSVLKSQPRVSDKAAQIQQGRVMLERLSRELRQGDSITDATSSGLRVHTYVDGADCGGTSGATMSCWITYACSGAACTRTPDGGAAETVAEGIGAAEIFCYSAWDGQGSCPAPTATSPEYVGMRVSFRGDDGAETVTLDDGITMRNAGSTT